MFLELVKATYLIELQAAGVVSSGMNIPSDLFLCSALSSMGVSLYFQYKGDRDRSLFIGQWAAPFLLLGLYNKLVKLEGSE